MFSRFRLHKNQRALKYEPTGAKDVSLTKHKSQSGGPPGDSPSGTEPKALSPYELPVRNGGTAHSDKTVQEHSGNSRADPLGLDIIYEPESAPVVDLILFTGWEDQVIRHGIQGARILTFGYNAHFLSMSSKNTKLNISDFAKDLLFNMKFATGEGGRALNIGSIPIIFIVHSMGGLVAKKAIILGQNDEHYKGVIGAISAVVFLSTPHRGASMAANLNRILSAGFLTHSAKQYISELETNSFAIQEINDQFRNLAPNMSIISFFETRPTKNLNFSIMVLDKDSSVLGYPGEISKPLDADHHDVCKYNSQNDPNYISVRNALIHLIEKARSGSSSLNELEMVKTCLGSANDPHDDLEFFLERKLNGSCQWVLGHQTFTTFLSSDPRKSQMLWCTGRPGRGKSVLSSFIINHLLNDDFRVAFYFFRFGDHSKNNVGAFLTSIAYQIATQLPEYRQRFIRLFEEGLNVQKAAPRLLWHRLFVSSLFNISVSKPLFLIIDGLDECEGSPLLINLLADIVSSDVPIHAIMASRPTQLLTSAFTRTSKAITLQKLPLDEIQDDLQAFVEDGMITMHGDHSFKKRVEDQILQKADGNFLWISFVLREILDCHTEEEVERALEDVPKGLESVYERIDATLSKNSRPVDLAMGRSILMWITCSNRALTISELAEALKPKYPHVLDLQFSISRACGEFVVIDGKGIIGMIHATARDYLIKTQSLTFHVPLTISHQRIFATCLSLLISSSSNVQMRLTKAQSFLSYAATSWAYHLALSAGESYESSLSLLVRFFRGHSVLSWIYILSISGQLQLLVQASKAVFAFLNTANPLDPGVSRLAHCVQGKELLNLWVVDLTKLVGKFGVHLISHPRLIFKLIAPFCPPKSAIYQQFSSKAGSPMLSLSGLSSTSWDSYLAKFVVPGQYLPTAIECFIRHFAILIPNGSVMVYSTNTCEIEKTLSHGEHILSWCFDQTGNKLATYGTNTTTIWSVAQGVKLCSVKNPLRTKALKMAFAKNEQLLTSCSDDGLIRHISLGFPEDGWQVFGKVTAEGPFDGKASGTPHCVSFNPEGTQIAVSYRASPLYIWSIQDDQPFLVGRCEREISGRPGLISNSSDMQVICWNALTGHILGVLNHGCVFKWHPLEGDYQESDTIVGAVNCSPDGKFFVSSSKNGTLRIWDFYHFTIVHELSCAGPVTSLAIDSNNARIYDIRENFCNIWEPSPLVRFEDADNISNDSPSSLESTAQRSLITETSVEILPQVTALALDVQNSTYAAGNDDGIITWNDSTGKPLVELAVAFMTVEHICWSDDGTHVAYSDLSRTINVKRVNHIRPSTPPETVLAIKEEHRIRQLHLSSDGKYLLVASDPITRIWSIDSKKIISHYIESAISYWINSPSDSSRLMGFGNATTYVCTWDNMTDSKALKIDRGGIDNESDSEYSDQIYRKASAQSPLSPVEAKMVVDKVLLTADGAMALIETSQGKDRGRHDKKFMLLPTTHTTVSESQAVIANPLPTEVRGRIGFSLGFLAADFATSLPWRSSALSPSSFHGSHLFTFLDKEFWVCTYMLGESQTGRIKRHFILPCEWWNMDSLELAVMRSDGALLCPRNGEVAVFTNGLREEWVE